MVMIINGYVALSNLNTGFVYIVVVNLGACAFWGFIDGFIYSISKSIERNTNRKKLLLLKTLNAENSQELSQASNLMDDTLLANFDGKGKEAITKVILENAANTSVEENKILNKEELLGWLSIILIYVTTGFALALPFLVLPDKINAWLVSNAAGSAWLFWYGVQLGKSAGKYRMLLGVFLVAIGISFLGLSYFVWSGR